MCKQCVPGAPWFFECLGTRLGCRYKHDDMTSMSWIMQETSSLLFCILQAIKTGWEGLGTRLDTRCLPAFSIHLISCRSRCRRELNKPTDMVGCYSVQHFREWHTYEESTRLHGVYHHMLQQNHSSFMRAIHSLSACHTECLTSNSSCGTLLSLEPGGKGDITVIHTKARPFAS